MGAIGSISGSNGVTSKADWEGVNAALGRVIASVPESTVMDVYNSVSSITDSGVPAYLKSLVNGADAEKAYAGFLEFKDVVKKNQVTSAGPTASVPSGDKIGEAAKKLSDASYPFLKEVDWLSDLYNKPLPGVTAQQAIKAVDKTIGQRHGRKSLESCSRSPPQSHRQHRWPGSDISSRFRGRGCGSWTCRCFSANFQDYGCLQRLGWYREWSCPQQAVLDSEST